MLSITELSLYHFKNYESKHFVFHKPIVAITGRNGCGKTSILDAIHFLSFTKSYFLHQDAMAVTKGTEGMRVNGKFAHSQQVYDVTYVLRENGKKEFSLDQELYTQLSKHIGKLPCIFISPDDTVLISEGSELRRKYLDVLISQTDQDYMQQLMRYNKVLQQRNSLLKQWNDIGNAEKELLKIYNEQMSFYAEKIFNIRKLATEEISTYVQRIYSMLSCGEEAVSLTYLSTLLKDDLILTLQQNEFKDIASQRSNYGIHKDDLIFELDGMLLKQVASQGQRKSFLFGLKLAAFTWAVEKSGITPILLLDDIFEKLDQARSDKLIEYISMLNAQVFITDTHLDRLQHALSGLMEECQFINLD
jgi:DNA replication and repair protein RecF